MTSPERVAVIGCGLIGKKRANALAPARLVACADVDPARAASFYAAIRTYWPVLPDGCLQPAYSGIRPKTLPPANSAAQDFVIQGPREHGIAGLVCLYGMESPGLTASLAVAEHVAVVCN